MTTAAMALQRAIKARLDSDSYVTELLQQRIYDDVPANATLPYAAFGSYECDDRSTDCHEIADSEQEITVFSRALGSAEVKTAAGAIRAALHGHDLEADDYDIVNLVLKRVSISPDSEDVDPDRRSARLTFACSVQRALPLTD